MVSDLHTLALALGMVPGLGCDDTQRIQREDPRELHRLALGDVSSAFSRSLSLHLSLVRFIIRVRNSRGFSHTLSRLSLVFPCRLITSRKYPFSGDGLVLCIKKTTALHSVSDITFCLARSVVHLAVVPKT